MLPHFCKTAFMGVCIYANMCMISEPPADKKITIFLRRQNYGENIFSTLRKQRSAPRATFAYVPINPFSSQAQLRPQSTLAVKKILLNGAR